MTCVPSFMLSPQYLNNFIDVYGNRYRRLHFIAIRFKLPIFTYKAKSLHSIPIEIPNNCIIVILGKCPPLKKPPAPNILFFTDDLHTEGIPISNGRVDTMLRQLFRPVDKILFSYFKSDVLFLVATENPFSKIMENCKKDQVFRAICSFVEARQNNRPLSLFEVSQLRFFKRYNGILKQFNKWSYFAFELCSKSCYLTTFCNPSAYLGREIFLMLQRSDLPPGPLPPSDFYQCEILFTETEPVGVAYSILCEKELDLEYVSPMVVSKPDCTFRDSGSVVCNAWIPLYQNSDMWRNYGLKYYAENFYYKKIQLKMILSWLQLQTSEKYKLIYMDLVQVAKIVVGSNA